MIKQHIWQLFLFGCHVGNNFQLDACNDTEKQFLHGETFVHRCDDAEWYKMSRVETVRPWKQSSLISCSPSFQISRGFEWKTGSKTVAVFCFSASSLITLVKTIHNENEIEVGYGISPSDEEINLVDDNFWLCLI